VLPEEERCLVAKGLLHQRQGGALEDAGVLALSGADARGEHAVGDALPERRLLRKRIVHMKRIEVARQLGELFDVFIESAVVGMRKPDPRIYQLVCDRLEVGPEEAVFLDDIGRNLKAARAMGITTIKVDDAAQALGDLGVALGLDFEGTAA